MRRQRQEKGWTQEELAGEAGVSKRTIERIENAQRRGFAFYTHTLSDVAAALDLPLATLIQAAADPAGVVDAPGPEIPEADDPAAVTTAPEVGPPIRLSRRRPLVLAAAAFLCVVGVFVWQAVLPFRDLLRGPPSAPSLPDRPSLAVLLFSDRSPDAGDPLKSESLARGLIASLSAIPSLFVVSPGSSLRYGPDVEVQQIGRELGVSYVLGGEVGGDPVRWQAQAWLIDTHTGDTIWRNRFGAEIGNRIDLMSSIVEAVAVATKVEIEEDQLRRIRRKPTDDLNAYEAVLKAIVLMNRSTRHDLAASRELLQEAIRTDPDFADAYSTLGAAYSVEFANRWNPDVTLLDRAAALADKAISLNPSLPQAYLTLANVHLFRGRTEAAIEAASRAIELDPSADWGHALLGLALAQSGQLIDAARSMNAALRLNPREPSNLLMPVALVRFALGRKREAAELLERVAAANPELIVPRLLLASYYERRGHHDRAQAAIAEVLRVRPDLTVAEAVDMFPRVDQIFPSTDVDGFRDRLLLLGLPSGPVTTKGSGGGPGSLVGTSQATG